MPDPFETPRWSSVANELEKNTTIKINQIKIKKDDHIEAQLSRIISCVVEFNPKTTT